MTTAPAREDSIVSTVRRFVADEVCPVAAELEHADRYPHALVARMRELGLFGALVPASYGGLGLSVGTYAAVIEELCRGFMSLAGVVNSHTMAALIVLHHGTEEQRGRFLPRFASGQARGGLCLTEPHAGSDVQAIRTVARRHGEDWVITGTKMFVTNGREGNTFALLAVTDPAATPRHRGMSCFIVEKGGAGLTVTKSIGKLGYKAVDTAELSFDGFVVPAGNLVGGVPGRGFGQVMSGLETGRINIAARAVGVARAAYDEARRRATAGAEAPPALADMATRLAGARLLTAWAAAMKDRGERCDLEAGMAKLWASETAQEVAVTALRLCGEEGQLERLPVERHYRDTPLMIIGEGTNEIQRMVIARQLVARHGDRPGAAFAARDPEADDRRRMVLAVRQFVDKEIGPAAREADQRRAYPAALMAALSELGVLGTLVPAGWGGIGADVVTHAMIVEELARGWATPATLVATHAGVSAAIARFGDPALRERWLPRLVRGDVRVAAALGGDVVARRDGRTWRLEGRLPLVDGAAAAALVLVAARLDAGSPALVLVERGDAAVRVGDPERTLGGRGLDPCPIHLDDVPVPMSAVLGRDGRGADAVTLARALARLGVAATAVGVAQAALDAALRYSQERVTFGQPICQHQAVQLKLADMATATAVARLLTSHAAERLAIGDADAAGMAKLHATESAYAVAFEAMRIHGGYGYTTEFPVERLYRDAARLLVSLGGNDAERRDLARRLAQRDSPGVDRS